MQWQTSATVPHVYTTITAEGGKQWLAMLLLQFSAAVSLFCKHKGTQSIDQKHNNTYNPQFHLQCYIQGLTNSTFF